MTCAGAYITVMVPLSFFFISQKFFLIIWSGNLIKIKILFPQETQEQEMFTHKKENNPTTQ